MRRRSIGGLLGFPVLAAVAFALVLPGVAAAAPSASLTAGFATGTRLDEGALLTAKAEFSGSEYHGTPPPVTELSVLTPKGTALSDEGLPRCPGSTLEPSGQGPIGCPFGSRVWSAGSFQAHIAFGKAFIPEAGTAEVFFAPGGGVSLFLFGHEPVLIEVLAHGEYTPAAGGHGPGLSFQLPFVESVPGAELMTLTSLTLPLGGFHESEGTLASNVTSAPECTTSLGWALAAKFDDEGTESSAETETTSTCPGAGKREATTTQIGLSAPAVGESAPEVVTAKVAPAAPSAFVPGGEVAVGADSFRGCDRVLVALAGAGEGMCQAESTQPGTHVVEAIYLGDAHFAPSAAAPASVSVLTGAELAERQRAEDAAKRKHEEEEAARRRAQEARAKAEAERREHEALAVDVKRLRSLLEPLPRLAKIRALLAQGGYRSPRITLPAGATVTVSWFAGSRRGGHPVLVAKGSVKGSGNGKVALMVRLTAAGRRSLRHRASLRITARGSLAVPGERTVTGARTFELTR